MNHFLTRSLCLCLGLVLCGMTDVAAAMATPQAVDLQSNQPSAEQQQASSAIAQSQSQATDQTQTLPDSPSTTRSDTQKQSTNQNGDAAAQEPQGTAAAQAAKTHGGAASKPAGAAIAPAKQRRTRSLLIKLGIIAGAGAALGTVYGLSKGSPSRPPGAR